MAKLILITGGARSGKSDYAQLRAEAIPGQHFFLATCPAIDEEMADRIARHKQDRRNGLWQTIEEEYDLTEVIEKLPGGSVCLLDCLTLWINNLMYLSEIAKKEFTEDMMQEQTRELLDAVESYAGTILMVSNEVGMGVVPDSPVARKYRDCVGRSNQMIASAADEVILVSCGLPLFLKG